MHFSLFRFTSKYIGLWRTLVKWNPKDVQQTESSALKAAL
jgi:hypothetical protein